VDSPRVRWSHGMPKIIVLVFILKHVGFYALHLANIAVLLLFCICFASSLEYFLC
jgi:hypothetical protein